MGGHFRAGVEAEVGTTIGSGISWTVAALGVGWDVFAEVGVGYAGAPRRKSYGTWRVVTSVWRWAGAGAQLGEHRAIVVRASDVDRPRAPRVVGAGIAWRL